MSGALKRLIEKDGYSELCQAAEACRETQEKAAMEHRLIQVSGCVRVLFF